MNHNKVNYEVTLWDPGYHSGVKEVVIRFTDVICFSAITYLPDSTLTGLLDKGFKFKRLTGRFTNMPCVDYDTAKAYRDMIQKVFGEDVFNGNFIDKSFIVRSAASVVEAIQFVLAYRAIWEDEFFVKECVGLMHKYPDIPPEAAYNIARFSRRPWGNEYYLEHDIDGVGLLAPSKLYLSDKEYVKKKRKNYGWDSKTFYFIEFRAGRTYHLLYDNFVTVQKHALRSTEELIRLYKDGGIN